MEALDEFADPEALLAQVVGLDRRLQAAKVKQAAAQTAAQAAEAALEAAEGRLAVYEAATAQKPPAWLSPKRAKRGTAVAVAMLSDTHWDEVVRPEEVGGVNKYDRAIAEQRLARWVTKVIELSRDYVANVEVTSLVVLLGGDLVSGDLHEELKESNEGTSLETVVHWSALLASALTGLADHFGRVHVAAVVGNHGRRTRKPRSKGRVHDNFDWMLAHSAATMLAQDDRFTWHMPETTTCLVEILGTRIMLTHGDAVRGGGGIGGIWPPIKRHQARLQGNPSTAHDIMCIGHWHQLVLAPSSGLVVNGSPKGWDEYAATSAFEHHPHDTAQACFWVTPEHGVTMAAPAFVVDRKAEGW